MLLRFDHHSSIELEKQTPDSQCIEQSAIKK
jgi:hypothetical protein